MSEFGDVRASETGSSPVSSYETTRPHREHRPTNVPQHALRLSVIVPVRNEERDIAATLQMLLDQEFPRDRFEILVVDGMSSDGTVEIVRQFIQRGEPIRLLDNPRIWSSAARNIGATRASGDVVLVIDGHCELPTRQHFTAVASAFQRSRADVIGRPQPLTIRDPSDLQRAIALARASRLGHHPDSYIYSDRDRFVPAQSVGAAYRREVFQRVGMFDERFDACEDVDFNYRVDQLGLSCFLSADSKVYYAPRTTLAGLFRQLARYGRGRVRLARKHHGMLSWKSLAPAAFVALVIVGLIVGFLHAVAWYAVAALLSVYLAAVLIESARILRQQPDWRMGWWLPWVFATIHVSAGVGIWQEFLFGPRMTRWNGNPETESLA